MNCVWVSHVFQWSLGQFCHRTHSTFSGHPVERVRHINLRILSHHRTHTSVRGINVCKGQRTHSYSNARENDDTRTNGTYFFGEQSHTTWMIAKFQSLFLSILELRKIRVHTYESATAGLHTLYIRRKKKSVIHTTSCRFALLANYSHCSRSNHIHHKIHTES